MTRHRLDFKASKTSDVLYSVLHTLSRTQEECFNYRRDIADQLGIRRSVVEGIVPSKDVAGAEETTDPEPLTDRARRMVSLPMFTWA